MGTLKDAVDISVERVVPFIKKYLDAKLHNLPYGIVKRNSLNSNARLKGEVFAVELLSQDIVFEKKSLNSPVGVIINRHNVTHAIISNEGKNSLCYKHVTPYQKILQKRDREYHNLLANPPPKMSQVLNVQNLPLRWASGGVLSVVTRNNRKWIPLFFRDIRPYGWNLSLGSSERYFDTKGKVISDLDHELSSPWQFIFREFLEELLVLRDRPSEGLNELRSFTIPSGLAPTLQQNKTQFTNKHIILREEYDKIKISEYDSSNNIYTNSEKSDMYLNIINKNSPDSSISDVLICFSLLDLGIEVVKILSYNIEESDYILDGEVIDSIHQELVRMPVALISCSYLQSVFGGNFDDFRFTTGHQPSIIANKPMPYKDIHIFDWDVLQRIAIIKGDKNPIGTELRRYIDWYDKFRDNFLDDNDRPSNINASRLFTPATAKLLNLFFKKTDKKIWEDII